MRIGPIPRNCVQTTTTNRKGRAEGIDCCLLVVLMKKGGGLDKQTNI